MAAFVTCVTLAACSSTPTRAPTVRSEGVSRLDAAQAEEVVLQAMAQVGVPYRYGGSDPATGLDCSGLVGYVYMRAAGLPMPRTVSQLQYVGAGVPVDEARAGDLVIFGGVQGGTHAGIYVGQQRFVHAPSTGKSVRLDALTLPYWKARLLGFRRP